MHCHVRAVVRNLIQRKHDGFPLTIRSFGVLRAVDTPPVDVVVDAASAGDPVNGSDAAFAAVAAATWLAQGAPPAWPTGHGVR
jgi:hypothetical protein